MAFMSTNGNISLRPVVKTDLLAFAEFRNNIEDIKNFRTFKPLTEFQQDIYWTNIVNNDKHYVFTICKTDNINYIIGECRISNVDWRNRKAELGIIIAPKERKKGVAYKALSMLFNYGFNILNLNRLEASIIKENQASYKLFRKLMFREEGTLYEAQYFDGKYHDILVMSLLQKEYYKFIKEGSLL